MKFIPDGAKFRMEAESSDESQWLAGLSASSRRVKPSGFRFVERAFRDWVRSGKPGPKVDAAALAAAMTSGTAATTRTKRDICAEARRIAADNDPYELVGTPGASSARGKLIAAANELHQHLYGCSIVFDANDREGRAYEAYDFIIART